MSEDEEGKILLSRIIKVDMSDSELRPFSMRDISAGRPAPGKPALKSLFKKAGYKGSAHPSENRQLGADELLNRAIQEADRCIRDAKTKVSDIEREAYEKAFAKGEQAGVEMGMKKAEAVTNSFYNILEELSVLREKIYEKSENELVKLALVVSRSIIHQELTLSKEVVLNTIKSVLRNTVGIGRLKIRISPLDIDFIRRNNTDILRSIDGLKSITLEEDTSIIRGGCVIETDFGDIDARIENQIEELDRVLKTSLREED